MELARRRILACDVTSNPTAEWASSVVKRAFFAGGGIANYLLRDRDGVYGSAFSAAVRGLGLQQVVSAYQAPKMNAHCERLIGTLRHEWLDRVIVLGEKHAGRLLDEYADDYDAARCHQALGGDAPGPRVTTPMSTGRVVGTPVLGGLHRADRRAA